MSDTRPNANGSETREHNVRKELSSYEKNLGRFFLQVSRLIDILSAEELEFDRKLI